MTGKFDDVGIPIIIWNKGKKEWETIYMPKMTEKRFKYIIFDGFEDNGEHLDPQEVVKLLNELHDENKELRILVSSLKQQNRKFKGRLNDLGVEYYD